MRIQEARDERAWESFLKSQPWSPFLQSWTMGEVYRTVGQEPVRLEIRASTRASTSSRVVPSSPRDVSSDTAGTAQHDVQRSEILGICQAIVVPAKRGKHLSVPYGPVLEWRMENGEWRMAMTLFLEELKKVAKEKGCGFIRMSPFCTSSSGRRASSSCFDELSTPLSMTWRPSAQCDTEGTLHSLGFRPSPLHLLAEHIWYLNLQGKTPLRSPMASYEGQAEEDIRKEMRATTPLRPVFAKASTGKQGYGGQAREEEIWMGMRKTTRNLIRRAEREGVTVEVSDDPVRDLPLFLTLHEETRMRHGFTPYTDAFFRAQVEKFSEKGQCALYLARYRGEVVATSIHMIYGGETSYHHGASSYKYGKIPASYLLQWRAIQDAMKRGDRIYNFWGVAPSSFFSSESRTELRDESRGTASRLASNLCRAQPRQARSKKTSHPFRGVTTFKTGFGGQLLELVHCMDLPISKKYWVTFGIETWRKWRRGF